MKAFSSLPFAISATYYHGGLNVRFRTSAFRYNKVPMEIGERIAKLNGEELLAAFDREVEGKYKSERIAG